MSPSSPSSGLLREWLEPVPVEVDSVFQASIGGHPLIAQVLTRRGHGSLSAAQAFMDPGAYIPSSPEAFPNMVEACLRIERAIDRQEKIAVWGDFDVDGQCSTTLLVSALRGLGANVDYHIPVRERESHGVNVAHLSPMIDNGARLILTCDTGISAHEAMNFLRSQNLDAIITDHHALPEFLPPAYAIINPRLLPENHPLSGLPGAGVAFKLIEALYTRAGKESELDAFLDLVALAIVADVAEQKGDTRYLLQRGLPVLREGRRAGLRALFELSNLQAAYMTEEHIGFVLGPRLNALGRLDDANPAVEFLTTSDPDRARVLAIHLEGLNARRRLLTAQVLHGAQQQVERDPGLLENAVLVLANPAWPAGVIGIVASELAERYNRPTILLSTPTGQPARGSARSIEGVNITTAIESQKNLLLGFGGHPMAAGLSLDAAQINQFRRGISLHVEKTLGGAPPKPTLSIDGEIRLADLSLDFVTDLERLAPFGAGNPPLILSIPRLTILNSSTIGRDGSHLQIVVKDAGDQTRRVLWWGGADWPLPDGVFDLACMVRSSNFRGQQDVQIEWVDARPIETETITLRRTRSIVDQRGLDHPIPVLRDLLNEAEPGGMVVWAEGEAAERLSQAKLATFDRTNLTPSPVLILWSTPPGPVEIRSVLESTNPDTVIVFGVDPTDLTAETFLRRLAGLAKFAIDRKGGQVSFTRLASATAQREPTVRIGLSWLEQRGLIQTRRLSNDEIQIIPGLGWPSGNDKLLLSQLTTLLEETKAFRRYFQSAEKDNLF